MEERHLKHSLLLGSKPKLFTIVFCCFLLMASLYGAGQAAAASSSDIEPPIGLSNGLIMLDYETVPLPQGKSIDLHGINYLQQLNDWLYFGVGAYAPLLEGDYGGFMAVGATVHVQKKDL